MAIELNEAPGQPSGPGADANQFLTFSLGDESYGIDILKVQEIKGYVPTTRLPNTPTEVTGVLNLRGTIVPIVDLRCKFGLPEIEYNQFTAIVVVVVQSRVMGVIVDSVSEVVNISPADTEPTPDFGASSNQGYLQGMAKLQDKLIILLDIETVLLGKQTDFLLAA